VKRERYRIADRLRLRYYEMVSRLPSRMRYLLVLLIAAVTIGPVGIASACTQSSAASQGEPCCPTQGHQAPEAPNHCPGARAHSSEHGIGCALLQCGCSQPSPLVHARALERRSKPAAILLSSVFSAPPVAAHLIPPPSGPPPIASLSLSPGRRTYLATLRLRI
jgi:hypothetical protein